MDGAVLSCFFCKVSETNLPLRFSESWKTTIKRNNLGIVTFSLTNPSRTKIHLRKPIKKLNNPENPISIELDENDTVNISDDDMETESQQEDTNPEWDPEEIETISSLFKQRIPQKPGKKPRERPLPLPIPHKQQPLGLPSSKKFAKTVNTSRKSLSTKLYKNPTFLISLAKQIKNLPPEKDVSTILNTYTRFLRKNSLSITVRELGHMGLPERALQIFCWVQTQPHLSPDDKLLASTVEVLARNHELKLSFKLEKFLSLSSQNVYEAVVKGFIKSGNLKLAYKLVITAKNRKIMVDSGVHAKLILEMGKNPDNYNHVRVLLEELGEREDLNLTQQDCTSIMKVCVKLCKFEIVEGLFRWFKDSGGEPSVVMYTTVVYSRYCGGWYREAVGLVWEMEGLNCLFDLPAYRVVIKLFVAVNDLERAVRYFSRLKEAGFSVGFDIYLDVIRVYAVHGRIGNCKEVCKEAEVAGFKMEERMMSVLMELNE
ncbi:hypothetical protein LXL04_026161 [Taraxacum kok-saghyz]